ncbi:bifunctional nicotinamidase/pyrazinamidase [Bacteroidales bacterium OttesenSCG-928-K03]|nr:bifunctional nicotinamidase/pyrazinamidase [Odoribacter sp. OttesenSCG-928-L07]MDL2239366.1 bifunctional nicotinamidase/pyrazinamidase [Bacteroidales bacterium OttesenSCG-928-L14]MDL2240581.1 bifunctional nicotinamidase/pyrazinamidase [Bacteroidales bacterium OttesenSCG-928-K22]MDL2242358.1 bifunctional nicotinamidase/pyrazinamidase [Bacteroidales bacterium OttesenSCG-928-K03]
MNTLLVVDVQNDFLPGGQLGINNADSIIEKINEITKLFDYCIFTKDWHPANHSSFINIWPKHCIQYSSGAEFSKNLIVPKDAIIIYKGMDNVIDSYSAFFDNDKTSETPLNSILLSKKVDTIYICGLATDYCVKYSVMDALSLGYKTYVIADLTRAVNVCPNDYETAIEEMKNAGAIIVTSDDLKLNK